MMLEEISGGVSCPTPLLKQDHLEHVAKDHVQTSFEYLQGCRLHNLSEPPVPVLSHHLVEKKVLPDLQVELSAFQVLPIAASPLTGHH